MSVIVRDDGFTTDGGRVWLDLPPDTAPEALAPLRHMPAIRIRFDSFADGRGFTLASLLRRAGFSGRLRAFGPLIADQYAMARRSGFDEVEIPDEIAARQPEALWIARAESLSRDYRARMRRPG